MRAPALIVGLLVLQLAACSCTPQQSDPVAGPTTPEQLQQSLVAAMMAEDAEAALDLIEGRNYDVIFLDVVLPEMDGYKVCKLIKADAMTRSIPIVMLTGKSSPFNKVRGVMAGCDHYLTKPVDAERLRTVLHEFIPEMQAR